MTKEEVDYLKKEAVDYITSKTTAPLSECENILTRGKIVDLFSNRTPKMIQDRIRSLMK